mmetsp:Transcript_18174/g.63842  ORF Transcript_18174/g.63842 Transcript_18174/m.63842 type:complete len:261 (+) Transcript_18174:2841-3623(+)
MAPGMRRGPGRCVPGPPENVAATAGAIVMMPPIGAAPVHCGCGNGDAYVVCNRGCAATVDEGNAVPTICPEVNCMEPLPPPPQAPLPSGEATEEPPTEEVNCMEPIPEANCIEPPPPPQPRANCMEPPPPPPGGAETAEPWSLGPAAAVAAAAAEARPGALDTMPPAVLVTGDGSGDMPLPKGRVAAAAAAATAAAATAGAASIGTASIGGATNEGPGESTRRGPVGPGELRAVEAGVSGTPVTGHGVTTVACIARSAIS